MPMPNAQVVTNAGLTHKRRQAHTISLCFRRTYEMRRTLDRVGGCDGRNMKAQHWVPTGHFVRKEKTTFEQIQGWVRFAWVSYPNPFGESRLKLGVCTPYYCAIYR